MRRLRPISFVLIAVLVAAFVGTSTAKTLRYATQDEPQTLDPHSASLAVTTRLLSNVYDPLIGRDKNFNLVPWLALSWTQPDALTWRFKLRPNVKFHDGAPFTADDVVFSVERALSANSQMKSTVQGVARAKKIDDLTVDIIMREPNPVLLNHLFGFRIMNKAWATKNNALNPQKLQRPGRHVCLAQRQWHGPLHIERTTDRREDGAGGKSKLVEQGQPGAWQCHRGDFAADQIERNARGCTALRRS